MKTKSTLLALLISAAAFAAEPSTDRPVLTVPLDDATKPAEVRIDLGRGDLIVRGTDESASVSLQSSRPTPVERKDGLRVISSNSGGMSVRQNANVVHIAQDFSDGKPGHFEIRVPRSASVIVNSSHGGKVGAENLSGDVEIKSVSGEIALRDFSGGALVETANGRISAFYTSLPADKAISFTSMNGEIELRVPSAAKANVRLRTHNGNVLTDFEDAELSTQVETMAPTAVQEMARTAGEAARAASEAARAAFAVAREQFEKIEKDLAERRAKGEAVPSARPVAPTPPAPPAIPAFSGGKVVTGTLNGGGTEIQIATMNGDIILRKQAP